MRSFVMGRLRNVNSDESKRKETNYFPNICHFNLGCFYLILILVFFMTQHTYMYVYVRTIGSSPNLLRHEN